MRARTAWLAGAAGAALAAYRRLRRQVRAPVAQDSRADELRQRLEESRAVVEEQHEEAASRETPVDEADVEIRRQAVHERARAAAEKMRGDGSGGE